ncbi:MAG: RNA polymerase sigma factor [Paenibacillaceae bacterium]
MGCRRFGSGDFISAFAALPKLWQPLYPKAYLFRIATNTWLNQCRKRQIDIDSNETVDIASTNDSDPFIVHEAIAVLARVLPPRQAAVLFLIDVFDFRADEVGEMVGLTDGAVKAILHRARTRMKEHHEVNGQTIARIL